MCSDACGPASAGSDASLKLGQSQAGLFMGLRIAQAASALNSRGYPPQKKSTQDSQTPASLTGQLLCEPPSCTASHL